MMILETAHDDARTQTLILLQKAHARAHTPAQSGHAFEAQSEKLAKVRFFLALEGEEPLGCIGLMALEPGVAEIKTMHVVKAMRGQGIGRQLLKHALELFQ
ncbi:MAG: GNAT family N-acetyltransferase [Pseudomonadota bacterium]